MKAYGMTRRDSGDTDVARCISNGRKTSVYSLSARAYRSLRGGKKAAVRRQAKRVARKKNKELCKSNDH